MVTNFVLVLDCVGYEVYLCVKVVCVFVCDVCMCVCIVDVLLAINSVCMCVCRCEMLFCGVFLLH